MVFHTISSVSPTATTHISIFSLERYR